jgi:transcriptional regulator with XRE-family HTH domain
VKYGQLIKTARMSKGIKGKFVAEKLRVSLSTYYEIEANRRSVTLERADEIAHILGMSLIDLLRHQVSESLKTKTG